MEGKASSTTSRTLTPEQRDWIASEGERIFSERVSEEEKRQHHGQYVAIDVVDGRYAFGADPLDAHERLQPIPEGHFEFGRRIGLPFRAPRSIRL